MYGVLSTRLRCRQALPMTTISEPPIRGEAAEGEAHTSSHSFKNNLNTMHGQPLILSLIGVVLEVKK